MTSTIRWQWQPYDTTGNVKKNVSHGHEHILSEQAVHTLPPLQHENDKVTKNMRHGDAMAQDLGDMFARGVSAAHATSPRSSPRFRSTVIDTFSESQPEPQRSTSVSNIHSDDARSNHNPVGRFLPGDAEDDECYACDVGVMMSELVVVDETVAAVAPIASPLTPVSFTQDDAMAAASGRSIEKSPKLSVRQRKQLRNDGPACPPSREGQVEVLCSGLPPNFTETAFLAAQSVAVQGVVRRMVRTDVFVPVAVRIDSESVAKKKGAQPSQTAIVSPSQQQCEQQQTSSFTTRLDVCGLLHGCHHPSNHLPSNAIVAELMQSLKSSLVCDVNEADGSVTWILFPPGVRRQAPEGVNVRRYPVTMEARKHLTRDPTARWMWLSE